MNNPENFDDEEELKAENAFLQMKLMLESGITFHDESQGLEEIPPEIENQFLKNIIAFNEFSQNPNQTTVFQKIESPGHFKPVDQIPDTEIKKAWEELSEYLNKYGIRLDAVSPNISVRELYRFTTEELFQHEMDDLALPGWSTNFIYDEFHPDHVYDNTRLITKSILPGIFREEEIEYTIDYDDTDIRLNEHEGLSRDDLKTILNRFKAVFDKLEFNGSENVICQIQENRCFVSGQYSATGQSGNVKMEWKGNFYTDLIFREDSEYWYVTNVQIEGLAI